MVSLFRILFEEEASGLRDVMLLRRALLGRVPGPARV